ANCSCDTITTESTCARTGRTTCSPTSSSSGAGRYTCKPSSITSRPCCRTTGRNIRPNPSEKPMTLDETLLPKLNNWQPADAGRHLLAIPDEGSGWSAIVSADRCDALSCAVWELTLRRTAGAVPSLDAWAHRIAERVNGLLEPLRVVEVDADRSEAQLR